MNKKIFKLLIVCCICTLLIFPFLKKYTEKIKVKLNIQSKKTKTVAETLNLSTKITGINNTVIFNNILELSDVFNPDFFTTTFNFIKLQNNKIAEYLPQDINVNKYNFIDYFSNSKEFLEWLTLITQIKFNNDLPLENHLNNFLTRNLNNLFTELKSTKNIKNTAFAKKEYEYVVIFGSHFTNIETRLDFVLKSKHTNKNFVILTNSRIIDLENIDKNIDGKTLKTYQDLQREHNNKSFDVNIAYFIIKDNFIKKYKKVDFLNPKTEKLFLEYLQKQKNINRNAIKTRKILTKNIKNKIKIKTNNDVITEKSIANYLLNNSFYKKLNITILDTNILYCNEMYANTDTMLLNFLHFITKENKKITFKKLQKANIAFVSSNPYFFLKRQQIKQAFMIFFKNQIAIKKIKSLLKNNVETVVCSNILKNNPLILKEYLKMFADIIYLQYNKEFHNKNICLKYECMIKNKNLMTKIIK